MTSRAVLVLVLLLATAGVVGGCSSGVGSSTGGASGTSQCAMAPEPTDPNVTGVIAYATGRHNIEGTWQNGLQGSVLTIDVAPSGTSRTEGETGSCGSLVVDAAIHLATREGVLSVDSTTLRFNGVSAGLVVPVTLPDAYLHPDPKLPPLPVQGSMFLIPTATATLNVFLQTDSLEAYVFGPDGAALGKWSSMPSDVPFRRMPAYAVPSALAADCAPAATFTAAADQYTPFANADAAVAAATGTWIRCRAFGGPEHAALQISPDRTWRHAEWRDGQLVVHGGMQHDGAIDHVTDTSGANGPGFFQIDLTGLWTGHAVYAWGDLLIVSDNTVPPDLGADVYVRTNRPVAAATNPFADGERGGSAACAVAEEGTLDPDVGAALDSTLAGDWTLCSGESLEGFTRLRFDGQGGIALLDDQGNVIEARDYTAVDVESMSPSTPRDRALTFPKLGTDWRMALSRRPLKLLVDTDSSPSTARTMVLSAVP